jgi:hypothetical protein
MPHRLNTQTRNDRRQRKHPRAIANNVKDADASEACEAELVAMLPQNQALASNAYVK